MSSEYPRDVMRMIEDQDFPPGSKGYDGTAYKTGTVMRLTRGLAKKAFNKIEEQHG